MNEGKDMRQLTEHDNIPEYPKIETLYDRDEKSFRVIPDAIRCPEFSSVSRWHVTEKIDGTNVRVAMLPSGEIVYGGRTDNAQMPPRVVAALRESISNDAMHATFPPQGIIPPLSRPTVVLYGEGYGETVQKGGGNYRSGVAFRLFDVLVDGLWLTQEAVTDIAEKLGIGRAPVIADNCTIEAALAFVQTDSLVGRYESGKAFTHEGIIARSNPLMLDRRGRRVMWKLKGKDFE